VDAVHPVLVWRPRKCRYLTNSRATHVIFYEKFQKKTSYVAFRFRFLTDFLFFKNNFKKK
jgi:hypothetical protein